MRLHTITQIHALQMGAMAPSVFNVGENGLGPELCPDPLMQNITAWRVTNNGTVSTVSTGLPIGYNQAIQANAGDGTHDRFEQANEISGFVVDRYYRVSALVKPVQANADQGFFAFQFTNGAESILATGTDWQWLTTTVRARYTTGRTRIYAARAGGQAGDSIQIAALSIREIL